MKKVTAIRLVNLAAWSILLGLSVYDGFIAKNSHSFNQGQVRGGVYAALLIFLVVVIMTAYGTLKSGKGWHDVGKKIQKNLLVFISAVPFKW